MFTRLHTSRDRQLSVEPGQGSLGGSWVRRGIAAMWGCPSTRTARERGGYLYGEFTVVYGNRTSVCPAHPPVPFPWRSGSTNTAPDTLDRGGLPTNPTIPSSTPPQPSLASLYKIPIPDTASRDHDSTRIWANSLSGPCCALWLRSAPARGLLSVTQTRLGVREQAHHHFLNPVGDGPGLCRHL